MTIEEAVLEKLRVLPPDKQQEVLDFAQFLQQKPVIKSPRRLLKGALAHLHVQFTDDDLKEARREMWGQYVGENE